MNEEDKKFVEGLLTMQKIFFIPICSLWIALVILTYWDMSLSKHIRQIEKQIGISEVSK
jgi:hypothetical protein